MKILLVEDHRAMRQMIADHLAERGFAVDVVGRGEDAITAVAVASYDAVILDLGLPDLDGMDVLVAIRARTGTDIPTLILTARDAVEDRVQGLNTGADDYLVKPFDLPELEARLRAVVGRPGVRRSTTHACRDLVFDTVSREAFVGNVPLELARREAALLEELMRAAGRVVAKDVLEDRLYTFDEAASSNALEAAVSRLRKKMAAAGAAVRIETKRGIGYRLMEGGDR
jgi:two-component system, OmpR family, response regulator QseB